MQEDAAAPFAPLPTCSPDAGRHLRQAAAARAHRTSEILLVGETGVGKEVFANAIHAHSGRTGKLVAINCAAIPRELVESELFGYEKGAHSTAQGRKVGLVELADGGTLFLDEIGDMPSELQSKLLRFLQDRRFTPLGSHPRRRGRRAHRRGHQPHRRWTRARQGAGGGAGPAGRAADRAAAAARSRSRTSAGWSRTSCATCATAARSNRRRSTRSACTRGRSTCASCRR